MIRTLTTGLGRVARALLDPEYDPDAEHLAQLRALHRAALLALAAAAIRAQKAREEGSR